MKYVICKETTGALKLHFELLRMVQYESRSIVHMITNAISVDQEKLIKLILLIALKLLYLIHLVIAIKINTETMFPRIKEQKLLNAPA